MSRKRPRSESPEKLTAEVYRSEPIEDRASTFIAAYSPIISAKDLQALPDFKTATHRIAAWRTLSTQRSLSEKPIYNTGHDDDGEQYAGKKLERILSNSSVEGAVVVARWYGGILLGPVRFTYIEKCAREAIQNWQNTDKDSKKRKSAQKERADLENSLKERDQSIVVLRQLLAEKSSQAEKAAKAPKSELPIEYAKMDMATLKRLEKARDGTITWLLKAIDKAEQAVSL